jgi:hypothetical protein
MVIDIIPLIGIMLYEESIRRYDHVCTQATYSEGSYSEGSFSITISITICFFYLTVYLLNILMPSSSNALIF